MKKKYGIDRGTRGIIIKWINNVAMQLGTKIIACKLLRKFCKDEVPARVIAIAAQCAEGTSMSWEPYLSKLFQVDYKYVQDASTKFHYSWLITLIDFMGWREPKHIIFCTTPQLGGAGYRVPRSVPLAKHKRENGIVFKAYLREI
jgi:hypothetical protein